MTGTLAAILSADQIFKKCLVELHARVEWDVVDTSLKALLLVERTKAFDFALIVGAVAARIDDDFFLRLGVLELSHPLVRKIALGFVEDVEQDNIVAAMPQPPQRLKHG